MLVVATRLEYSNWRKKRETRWRASSRTLLYRLARWSSSSLCEKPIDTYHLHHLLGCRLSTNNCHLQIGQLPSCEEAVHDFTHISGDVVARGRQAVTVERHQLSDLVRIFGDCSLLKRSNLLEYSLRCQHQPWMSLLLFSFPWRRSCYNLTLLITFVVLVYVMRLSLWCTRVWFLVILSCYPVSNCGWCSQTYDQPYVDL